MSHRTETTERSPVHPVPSGFVRAASIGLVALLLLPALASHRQPEATEPEQATPKKEQAWDVDTPVGPTTEQTIQTDEGTWISLDVSPDGSSIVFDLLGDLYTMPITGGQPTHLTSGMAWDFQPRFSPDGSLIAFTSDRTGKDDKGGDNIWVIDRDGSNARQITAETFRLLNGPAWSPDGQYIVARKHFTSRRSLGAGEMWMYHVSGVDGGASGGLQLTKRPTDQKDVNEPVFSPDGKYLYYSEDASPGQRFQYDKDSNKQIYVINRLDLATGESERYITGPGGACRPTPSPDGKTIAFVRRHNGKSALYLFETESGGVHRVYDDLERDMQEAWAIHGVYPAFAWTPDGRSIVFWARGKIRRLDLDTRTASVIPFHIDDTRTVVQALRFPIQVAPDRFDVRALRWVEVAPAGDRVVYQALGHIYVRDLPEGEPRRLTTQNDHFEFYPSFSRNGRFIVYTTWDDEDLGSVRVAAVDGSRAWTVTDTPGQYVEPTFSPDGTRIAFTRVAGGWLRSPLWSRDTGVYIAPAKGGHAELVTKKGHDPQFGADSDRLFVIRSDPKKDADNRSLVSIELGGEHKGREQVHYTSDWATDYRISPDGRWIAFVERFNVYLAPFVQTGRAIKVGPKVKSLPIAKVSGEAGEWIHFSGDSRRLHWSLGPTLYTRELTDSFAFLDGAPETLPEPPTTGRNIGFSAAHARPDVVEAFVGGRIVTMKGDELIDNGVVLVRGNRIEAVGVRGSVQIPDDAQVFDVSGQVIMPGLVDVHAHGAQATEGIHPQQNWVDYARLAFGVTTIHDPSNDTDSIFAASELAKAGLITAPRTFSTGTILYGAAGSFKAEIDSLDDARFHLRRMKAIGAFTVKSYNQPRRDQRQQVIAAAREMGMMVVPEGGSTFMHNMTMIVDGHTGVEHSLPVERIYGDVLDLWRDTGVGYTPTLVVAYGGLGGENYWYDVDEVWKDPRVAAFIPPHVIVPRARRRTTAPIEDYNHFNAAKMAAQVFGQGGLVQAGGHGQLSGLDTHWELWMLVQGGLTPTQAIQCGTINGARYLGLDADLGSIEPGKLADLIVIEPGHDPTVEIRDSEHIQYVVANGVVYDSRTMNRVYPDPAPREPFYWERDGVELSAEPPAVAGCAGCGRQ